MEDKVIIDSYIKGTFNGFNQDQIFELEDGSIWYQLYYDYDYNYDYNPRAQIVNKNGSLILRLPDLNMETEVGEANVIKSRIRGTFKGWDGNTDFELENGQVWTQARYSYKYMYAYYPEVLIANINGKSILHVKGNSIQVRRTR